MMCKIRLLYIIPVCHNGMKHTFYYIDSIFIYAIFKETMHLINIILSVDFFENILFLSIIVKY
jgi:hypothetical protein